MKQEKKITQLSGIVYSISRCAGATMHSIYIIMIYFEWYKTYDALLFDKT